MRSNREGAQGDEADDSSGGEQGTRIYFDLLRDENGKWAVEKLKIPEVASPVATPSSALFSDSLGVTDSFLLAVLAQNFDEAKSRRPNSTEDGEDNPTGRRANRRTEIYLDF